MVNSDVSSDGQKQVALLSDAEYPYLGHLLNHFLEEFLDEIWGF